MTKLLVEVHDQTKEEFLRELLTSLPYVSVLTLDNQSNGVNGHELSSEADDYNLFYQDPRQAQMENEVVAFETQHSELVMHYLGQYIALYQGQVIDHDLEAGHVDPPCTFDPPRSGHSLPTRGRITTSRPHRSFCSICIILY